MAFQFLCPSGHLLQGDEAHMGLQTQCPHCGVMFLIPVLEGAAAPQPAYEPADPYAGAQPGAGDFLRQMSADAAPAPAPEPAGIDVNVIAEAPADPGLLHIPCPNGHELETPLDMLGQEVLCPHCSAQFRLRAEDSREHLAAQEKRDRESAKLWFNWSIAAAVGIGIALLVMLIVALSPQ